MRAGINQKPRACNVFAADGLQRLCNLPGYVESATAGGGQPKIVYWRCDFQSRSSVHTSDRILLYVELGHNGTGSGFDTLLYPRF